jgi:hypothetical protein
MPGKCRREEMPMTMSGGGRIFNEANWELLFLASGGLVPGKQNGL